MTAVLSPTVAAPAVIATGVGRRFGDRTVLDGIDLRIAPGEFVALPRHRSDPAFLALRSHLLAALGV